MTFDDIWRVALEVIDIWNPKCIKRIKQNQVCYAEKSPTDHDLPWHEITLIQRGSHCHDQFQPNLPAERKLRKPVSRDTM